MMFTHKNLMTVCCAAVLALGLAACGGGGGDAPVTGMTDMNGGDTIRSSLVGKVFPDSTTFMLPAGLVDDITVSVKEGDTVDVPGVGNFRCVTGPCTVDVASDVVTTTGRIEVVSLAEGLPAEVLTALASIPEDAPAGPTPATPEQMTAAAATKLEAIGDEADQTADADADADLGGSSNIGDDAYTMTIKRDSDGTTVEIKDPENLKTVDPKFMPGMLLDRGRTMLVRVNSDDEDGKVEEVVIVKTDIKAAKAKAFGKVHALDVGDPDPAVDTDGDEDPGNDHPALAIVDGVDVRKLIKSAAFTRHPGGPDNGILTFDNAAVAAGDVPAVKAFETEGTYNGAMGTYRCAGSVDCMVTVGEDGKITEIGVGWIFTPAPGVTIDVADDDYLNYGFWLMRTTKDGATTYNEVETFAGSSLDKSEDLMSVEGTAEYEGGAVGVYVKNVFDLEGEIDTATSGHFVADASLKAYFGGNDVAESMKNKVTGTIDQFVLQHGEENAWSVALKGDITPDDATASGTANGGGPEGTFSATFHGSVAAAEDAAVGDDVPQPSSVVGEFNANFGDGTVAGGFGVNKK